MPDVFDIYTIIFLALAVFIFLRLRSVLGQRTGRERPPYPSQDGLRRSMDTVVPMPQRPTEASPRPAEAAQVSPADRWKDLAEPNSPAIAGLDAIAAADPSFDGKHFLTGARAAYEMIVTAFAKGDRRGLKNLLSEEVYQGFENAIAAREARGETIESHFIGIKAAEPVEAGMKGREAEITLRITSEMISFTKNADGAVIEGDPTTVHEIHDQWTFGRDTRSSDPNWKLIAANPA